MAPSGEAGKDLSSVLTPGPWLCPCSCCEWTGTTCFTTAASRPPWLSITVLSLMVGGGGAGSGSGLWCPCYTLPVGSHLGAVAGQSMGGEGAMTAGGEGVVGLIHQPPSSAQATAAQPWGPGSGLKGAYDMLSVSLGRRLGFWLNAPSSSWAQRSPSDTPRPPQEPLPAPQTLGCGETCAALQVRRGKHAVKEPRESDNGGQILHLSEPQFSNL